MGTQPLGGLHSTVLLVGCGVIVGVAEGLGARVAVASPGVKVGPPGVMVIVGTSVRVGAAATPQQTNGLKQEYGCRFATGQVCSLTQAFGFPHGIVVV